MVLHLKTSPEEVYTKVETGIIFFDKKVETVISNTLVEFRLIASSFYHFKGYSPSLRFSLFFDNLRLFTLIIYYFIISLLGTTTGVKKLLTCVIWTHNIWHRMWHRISLCLSLTYFFILYNIYGFTYQKGNSVNH